MAVGRQDWLFAGSKTGGERAAAIYTVQTCEANGFNSVSLYRRHHWEDRS